MFISTTIASGLYGAERSTTYINIDKIYRVEAFAPSDKKESRSIIFFSGNEDADYLVVYENIENLLLKITLARK